MTKKRKWTPMTKEQREERLQEAIKKQEVFLDKLRLDIENGKTEVLEKYLTQLRDIKSKGYSYSGNNAMLLFCQNTCLSVVMSGKAWSALGHRILKGEKGLSIYKPNFAPIEKLDSKTGKIKKMYSSYNKETGKFQNQGKLVGFGIVNTAFDISQTNAMEKLEEYYRKPTGTCTDFLTKLIQFTLKQDIQLTFNVNLGLARGMSKKGAIDIGSQVKTDAEKFSVLSHELAHEILHKSKERKEYNPELKELEAETVSYLIQSYIGLENNGTSAAYLANWRFCKESLKTSLNRITKATRQIIGSLE